MLGLVFIFVVSLIAVCCAAVTEIKVSSKANIADDVRSILHDQRQRQVTIDMAFPRRCSDPTFIVRLSGASLYKLDLWRHVEEKQKNNEPSPTSTYIFTYPKMVDPGTYFLEIIVIFFVSIDPNNFASLCPENPEDGRNVVSEPYSFEILQNATVSNNRPRWVLGNKDSEYYTTEGLPTRYQKICNGSYCEPSPSRWFQHQLYDWVDGPSVGKPLEAVLSRVVSISRPANITGPDGLIVCFIGSSHMRFLVEHAVPLQLRGLAFAHVWSTLPSHFKLDWIKEHSCSVALVSYGQWPMGDRVYHRPYTANKFEAEMRDVVRALQNVSIPVFLRSENYNALGAHYTACPPLDHRSPPVIDLLNAIISSLAAEFNVPYIDTNHIMGPMWDSAWDWNHPMGKVFTAEITYILHYVFHSILTSHKLPSWQGIAIPENALVRFSDGPSVFLFRKNTLRAFPNGQTFAKMGFDFGDVIVLPANNKLYSGWEFGPDLPRQ